MHISLLMAGCTRQDADLPSVIDLFYIAYNYYFVHLYRFLCCRLYTVCISRRFSIRFTALVAPATDTKYSPQHHQSSTFTSSGNSRSSKNIRSTIASLADSCVAS